MKIKTKRKDIKDLQYPCYFTAIPHLEERSDPIEAVKEQNQSLAENNPCFLEIAEHNYRFIQDLMTKTDEEVPDEDLFRFIQYDPAILGSRFAQEKIARWQRDNDTSSRAEGYLKRIGSTLALKRKRSPGTILLAAFLKDFLGEFLDKPERDKFVQELERTADVVIMEDEGIKWLYADIDCDRKNFPRLISLIIAKIMKTTEAVVKQYLKQVTDIYENDRKIGYAIEVSIKKEKQQTP